jgi:uncharacterized protein involved in exopolysaccharide biosynthesis
MVEGQVPGVGTPDGEENRLSALAPEAAKPGPVAHGEPASHARGQAAEPMSFVGALNVLLRRRGIVAGLPATAAVLAVLVSLLVAPTYTASTSFVPEQRGQSRLSSGVAGLAGQLGLSVGLEPSQSPQFYADVVRSRELLEQVLLSKYADPRATAGASDSSTLLNILRVNGRNAADSLDRAIKKLSKLVSVDVGFQTNIVRLAVDAPAPALAAEVANRLVEYLNEFNTHKRQSQARERRKFTEERVAEADSELRRSEEAVKTFYERNRGWQQAPEMVFQETRLRRQVEVRQEVYLTLKREYETARIEEVNDTPVLTVIDPAVAPPRRSKPRRTVLALVGFSVGLMVAVLWAFGAEYMTQMERREDHEYRELQDLLGRVGRSVGRLATPATKVRH